MLPSPDHLVLAVATKIHNEEYQCKCDPKYKRSCVRFADAVLEAGRRIREESHEHPEAS